jgi:hypothetical protein
MTFMAIGERHDLTPPFPRRSVTHDLTPRGLH